LLLTPSGEKLFAPRVRLRAFCDKFRDHLLVFNRINAISATNCDELSKGRWMENQQTSGTERRARSRRLVVYLLLAIAAIATTTTADYPEPGSWELPGICLGMYAIALSLLLAFPSPGVGTGFAAVISALLAVGSGLPAFGLWALSQGEVSNARDRQLTLLAAVACISNLSLLIAVLRYMFAVKDRLRWWHVVLGAAVAVLPAWVLMSRLV
jgi:hypothetical protein